MYSKSFVVLLLEDSALLNFRLKIEKSSGSLHRDIRDLVPPPLKNWALFFCKWEGKNAFVGILLAQITCSSSLQHQREVRSLISNGGMETAGEPLPCRCVVRGHCVWSISFLAFARHVLQNHLLLTPISYKTVRDINTGAGQLRLWELIRELLWEHLH